MLGMSAENLGTILTGIGLALIALLGGRKGKEMVQSGKKAAMPENLIEVAGAIVSDKAVDQMVKSLDAFTAAATLMTHSIDKDVRAKEALTKALERNSDVCIDLLKTLENVDDRLEKVKDELIRNGPR